MSRCALAAVASLLAAVSAFAISPVLAMNEGKLPEGAVPLSAAETRALYVGHTVKYILSDGVVHYTWRPDGKTLGIWEGTNGEASYADGNWSVSDNQFCFEATWYDNKTGKENMKYAPCKQWWKLGRARWTKNASGGEDKWLGDIYDNEIKKMSAGDQVSKKFAAIKKKIPAP
jgi:hypothetical protein